MYDYSPNLCAFYSASTFYEEKHRKEVRASLPVGAKAKDVVSITFLNFNCNYICIQLTYLIFLQLAKLRENWGNLDKEKKGPYELKAKEDRERHKREMAEYEKKMYDEAMPIDEEGGEKKPAAKASKPKSSKSGKKNKGAPSHDAASMMAMEESAARAKKRSRDDRAKRAKKRQARSGTSSEAASMVPSSEVASMVPSLGGGASEVASMVPIFPAVPSLPAIGGGGGKPSAKATVMADLLPTHAASSAGGSGGDNGSSTAVLSLAVTRSDSSLDAQQGTSDNEGNDVLAV